MYRRTVANLFYCTHLWWEILWWNNFNLNCVLFRHYFQGVKIKMDDAGNILVRRYAKSNIYVKSTSSNVNEETAIGAEILKLPNNALESEKIVKVKACTFGFSNTFQMLWKKSKANTTWDGLMVAGSLTFDTKPIKFTIFLYKIFNYFFQISFPVIRYEKVSIKCEPWIEKGLSRSPKIRNAMPFTSSICKSRKWYFGLPDLGAHSKCSSNGYAEK